MKRFFCVIFIYLISTTITFAFEDCMVINKYKLTDIKIEDNSVIDVCPLITVLNEKNILLVHPKKIGTTRFCVLKNDKDLVLFTVKVGKDRTIIEENRGFDILSIDTPDYDNNFEIDPPPILNNIPERGQ